MTKISKKLFNLLIEKELNRTKGETSSKTGRNYEDKASFYILSRFNKILKVKSKITQLSFNGLEDLDIFDDKNRIFSFQIKKRKQTWTKKDPDLLMFLENCIKRFKVIRDVEQKVEVRFYFFTNITGNFLEEWNRLHEDEPSTLYEKLPVKIKTILNRSNFTQNEISLIFSRIFCLTSQKSTFLDPYIDEILLKKFKEFKDKYNPSEIIEFIKFNEEIFYEKRLKKSRVYEPAIEKDLLLSNILEVDISKDTVYCARKKEKLVNNEIQEFLKKDKLRISYLLKYRKIYSFNNFDNSNPLSQFLKEGVKIEKLNLKDLDKNDRIRLLNDWLYHYLNHIGLKYYRMRNRRYFYFWSKGKDKYIDWFDPKAKKVKEWRVVKRTPNFFENLGAEIKFKEINMNSFIIIKPRLFFSVNGSVLLSSDRMREIEKSYRKSFMKNDFLRRRLFVILSYIKGIVPQIRQQEIFNYTRKRVKY
ncbi:MAG: hypothetical protein ACFFDB_17765, partial [Promethearchaeota archaeon]